MSRSEQFPQLFFIYAITGLADLPTGPADLPTGTMTDPMCIKSIHRTSVSRNKKILRLREDFQSRWSCVLSTSTHLAPNDRS